MTPAHAIHIASPAPHRVGAAMDCVREKGWPVELGTTVSSYRTRFAIQLHAQGGPGDP